MVIAVVLAVVGTISNSSGVAIMIQQQKLQQQIAYAATKGTSGSSGDGISLGDNTGGDNNSCRRERGGELGSRAGELGLSSKLCN
jgi:hypothetical protein